MNREIKFRVWDAVYDYDFDADDYTGGWVDVDDYTIMGVLSGEPYHAMQYTGLKDKNGMEIYEGDIVATTEQVWSVEFMDGGYQVYNQLNSFRRLYEGDTWFEGNDNHMEPVAEFCICDDNIEICEVIGNIYENKELLNG